jgi:sugar lactone lactonase YvrE
MTLSLRASPLAALACGLLLTSTGCKDDEITPPATGPADVGSLDLPGTSYYPESLTSSADGTLYVGGLGTGGVVKFSPQSTTSADLIAPATLKGVAGVMADDSTQTLYLCSVDTSGQTPSTVQTFDLATGAHKATYEFPVPAFCNDMALDGQHNLYVADSYGSVFRLANGTGNSLQQWAKDPLLAASTPQGFGADGISWDGQGNMYVGMISDNRLVRIPINANGSAGAITQITVTPALSSPDGMRSLDANTLLVAEGSGALVKVTVSGTAGTRTVLKDGLNGPSSVTVYQKQYWISEGQIGHLTGQVAGPPISPFKLQRVVVP